ncbi:MAG TPA: serine hydrolase domain-containing protein, partial [Gemmatimonadaceae bacterium]|nr:serine hydrolase domain-containing protein [Gemmatimonadaceae bacterium]
SAPICSLESQATCANAAPRIRSLLRAVQDKQKNVGLSAAVMHRGRLVYSDGMGFADIENRVPFTPSTRSTVASITKAFTGTTLAILADSGVIDLDAPIGRYVPSFHPPGSDRITLRLLAAHLGGVRHYRTNERTPEFLSRHFDDVKDIVSLVANDTLIDNPGDAYHYSSYGYNLLAAAIQEATHKPFATVVDELLFRPLKLSHTRFDDIRIVIENRARHYAYNDPWTYAVTTELRRVPEFDYTYNMGGGNIITTAEDLVRFGQAVIRPGRLSPGALKLVSTEKRGAKTGTNWGIGWFVNPDSAGQKMLHINGSFPGTQAALYVYPDDDIAVSVISNTWGAGAVSGDMVTTLPMSLANACRASVK